MSEVRQASVPILDATGRAVGQVHIALLPTAKTSAVPLLLDFTDEIDAVPGLEPVQLLEDGEYVCSIEVLGHNDLVMTDRPEVFSPDTVGGHRGRLRPGSLVGLLPITILISGREVGTASIEVRSRKLNYLSHYRWMLRDISNEASALVLEHFAASQQRLRRNQTTDAATSYERFVLLSAVWNDESTKAAIREIVTQPHSDWVDYAEPRDSARGLRGGSAVARQIAKAGARVDWPAAAVLALRTIPRNVDVVRSASTVDTTPNRFVKFVLQRWATLALDLLTNLGARYDTPSRRRGLREIREFLDQLESVLTEPLFREVGNLHHFPSGDEVIQKRAGYRDLLRAYVEVEGSSEINWSGGDDVFGGGQRNVAQLYEYWVFLQLVWILRHLCISLDDTGLVRVSPDGVDLDLRRGHAQRVTGFAQRLGRGLVFELAYNRSFGVGSSWTLPMRPDYSLRISATGGDLVGGDIWIHFDAKYRIDHLGELIEPIETANSEHNDAQVKSAAKRDDLLKMHAYRDAIQRSAGAFVIYPGIDGASLDSLPYRRYSEILPGLGAFALRPADSGDAAGRSALVSFIDDLTTHFASSLTHDRRGRYWEDQIFEATKVPQRLWWWTAVRKPPADTSVLLGYVRSQAHLAWIHEHHRYNLRADGRQGSVGLSAPELGSDLVLLYNPASEPELWLVDGQPELWSRPKLAATGYPDPRGEIYFCLCLGGQIADLPAQLLNPQTVLNCIQTLAPRAARGAPVVASLAHLLSI
jgi:predicted component of viral defense system (DUF524 family)